MRKIIYAIVAIFSWGCSDFLKEYSQDLVTVKTIEDFDEVILGSGYIPSNSITYIYGNTSYCPWLNFLADNTSTTGTSRGDASLAVDMVRDLFGYVTWQEEVGLNISRNHTNDDNTTWNNFYERINIANIILTEIEKIDLPLEADRLEALRVKGEAHFIRAQCYLTLVNLYANAYAPSTAPTTLGVPLKLTGYVEHDNTKDIQFERTPVAQVYDQIVKDLQQSIDFLTQSPQKKVTFRASKEAATLLLSRVYLYMQQWENAKKTAQDFLAMNDLLAPMNQFVENIFLTGECSELIFSQGTLNLQNALSGQGGDFCVSHELYSLYDTTAAHLDYRVNAFFTPARDSIGCRKYKNGSHRSYVSDNFSLRVAEGYLNLAEACAMTPDESDDVEGLLHLNRLREQRIKDYIYQNYSGKKLLDEVRLERRKELCFEGHRWFDLRRYAVCETHPFSKKIFRYYNLFNDDRAFQETQIYVLEENDPAYTFQIPRKVVEFDPTTPLNPRNKREQYFGDKN